MRTAVPPTTVAALDTWAAQKRQLYITIEQPIGSVLGKIKAERSAAGEGDPRLKQKWAEVYTGDGLLVERIVRTLRELPRLTLTYYYVLRWPWRVPIPDQAADLGIPKREYWRQLEVGEAVVDGALQVLQEPKTVRTLANA
jgi:hypothetical protein